MMKTALLVNVSQIGDIVSSSIVADSLIQLGFNVHFLMPAFVHALYENDAPFTLWPSNKVPGKRYDLAVDLTSNKASRRIMRSVNARQKIGRIKDVWQRCRHWTAYSTMVPKVQDGHIVRDYYPVLRALDDHQARRPQLPPSIKLPGKLGLADDANIVAIHFGASTAKRIIPIDLLSHAIQWLIKSGYKIVLLGTEEEIGHELVARHQGIPLFKKLTLGEVRAVLTGAKLFIGADSGLLHIAAALDCPSIGVYGPNIPAKAGPLSSTVSFFERDLSCRPCDQGAYCPRNIQCMNTLNPEKLVELIKLRLSQDISPRF